MNKNLTIIISSLSFVVSLLTLYLMQLRPAKLQFHFGRQFEIYYPRDGGFGIYVPITITNTSNKAGIVKSCALILSKATTEDEYYFFDLCGFGKRDEETGGWKFEQAAHPLVVPGKSSVSNVFWYVWRPWTRPSFRLTEGTWKVELVGITSEMTKPKGSKIRKVYFPQELVKVLEERRESNNPMS